MTRSATARITRVRATPQVRGPREKVSGAARGERNCSVARTLDIVSDAWAFLIIREAFFEALINPSKPSERLARALAAHKQRVAS